MSDIHVFAHTVVENDTLLAVSFAAFTNATSEENENSFFAVLSEFLSHFGVYVVAVVLASGIVGNLLSIVVFFRLRRRDIVTATYLGPLALSDLINLGVGVNGWIDNGVYAFSGGTVYIQEALSEGHCKFRAFLFGLCGSLSSGILLMFCVERCVAVWRPLMVATVFTQKRRKAAIVCVFMVCVGLGGCNAIYFKFVDGFGDIANECRPELSVLWHFGLFFVMMIVLYLFLPICILVILNVLILYGVHRTDRDNSLIESKERTKQNERKIIKNLVLVSAAYVFSMTPLAVFGGMQAIGEVTEWSWVDRYMINVIYEIVDFAYTFHYVNYSANYIIYVVSLDFYRAECRKVFCC
jgi:MFS family permease